MSQRMHQNNPMDEDHPAEQKKSRWWTTSRGAMRITAVLLAVGALLFVFRNYLKHLQEGPLTVLGAATAVAAVVVLIRVGQHYQWTGFGESVQSKPDNQEIQPRKTLWDWLQLFIVPLALAAIGLWFSAQQDTRQQQLEEQRAQNAALQAYLDQMSQLMLQGDLRSSDKDSEVRTLARARTQTVLGQLDSDRKASVVQFLYEASLINKEHPVVSLSTSAFVPAGAPKKRVNVGLRGADLRGADLRGADLSEADLSEAKLSGANLSDVNLSNAQLIDANLSWASLSDADLSDAELPEANLNVAILNDANLNGAILNNANLSEAVLPGAKLRSAYLYNADLRGADLTDAKGVTEQRLEDQTNLLEGATMPDRSMHD